MKTLQKILAALTLATSAQIVSAADITGKINLKGTPPPELEITPLKNDPFCGKLHSTTPKTRFYVVGPEGGLGDVFVHVKEGLSGKTYPTPSEPVVIDQKGCEYVPYVLAAQTKQKIVVKNSDPVLHNVHPTPVVAGNPEYNKAQVPKGPDLEFSWENPEIFLRIMCNVHPWMFAYVSLVEHPFFDVSDKEGTFKIANVPAGKYVIEAVHRKAGKVTKEVTVSNENQKVDFTLEVPAAKP